MRNNCVEIVTEADYFFEFIVDKQHTTVKELKEHFIGDVLDTLKRFESKKLVDLRYGFFNITVTPCRETFLKELEEKNKLEMRK